MPHTFTTPFGRRTLTAAQIQAQAIAAACPAETTVDKWAVLRHIAIARAELGLSDRTLAVLSALLSFHPETALQAGEGGALIVWPSNAQLALRAHGIAEKTLRRHLAVLVETGLVIRRDSPNGKRYVRKRADGVPAEAFGFDLVPIVARAGEFAAAANRIEAERRADRIARERLTLARRDLAKMIAYAVETALPGPWDELTRRTAAVTAGLGRRPDRSAVDEAVATFVTLLAKADKFLADSLESKNPTGDDGQSDRLHHNSKTETFESGKTQSEGQEEPVLPSPEQAGAGYPLAMVLQACPDIVDYARHGIGSWHDLVATADLVRSILGISPSSWRDARDALGQEAAAVLIAAILQRAEHIRSPGGYLRRLVERKRAGQFSLGPVLQALLRRREPERTYPGRDNPTPRVSGAPGSVA